MSKNKFLHFNFIKFNRYILGKKYMPVISSPLKGFLWSTATNYDYLTGTYEDPIVIETFLSWLQPHSVLYDLGAHVGYYSFLAQQKITKGIIYSFEPSPVNLEIFADHLALNKSRISEGVINIQPYAVSDKEKEVIFSDTKISVEGNSYMKDKSGLKPAEMIRIKSFSIDALVANGFLKPDVLKIDVEGAELEVLNGAVNTLRSCKPNILLATHDSHLPGIKNKCLELLGSLGYQVKHTGGYNKNLAGHDDFIAIHNDKN